jgi:hypothetical protein
MLLLPGSQGWTDLGRIEVERTYFGALFNVAVDTSHGLALVGIPLSAVAVEGCGDGGAEAVGVSWGAAAGDG